MRTATVLLLIAGLFLASIAVAPTAAARPDIPPGGGGEVCVPGLTFCCTFYNDGDITPMIRCL